VDINIEICAVVLSFHFDMCIRVVMLLRPNLLMIVTLELLVRKPDSSILEQQASSVLNIATSAIERCDSLLLTESQI